MVDELRAGELVGAVIYLLAMAALGMHLRHGTWSAAQTLGFTNSPATRRGANLAGYTLAVVIAGGFALVPLAVLVGHRRLTGGRQP